MPRLSRGQEETRQRIARLAGISLTPDHLARRVLEALQQGLPADGGRLFGVDPDTLLINRTLAASDNDAVARHDWLRHSYLAARRLPYFDFPTLMQAGLTAVAIQDQQERCWGYPEQMFSRVSPRDHYFAFQEDRAPAGGSLNISIPANGRWIAALQLYRRDASSPFRRGDVGFIRLIVPMIGQLLQAAFVRERAVRDAAITTPDASGIVILGPDLDVRFSTPAGEAWSAVLRAVERDGHGPLPTAVWATVAHLRAVAGERSSSSLVVPAQTGRVRIEASPAGEDGSIAIVLAAEQPPPPPAIPADWPLTRSERQVAELLLSGLTNREIAEKLVISENTVLSHLRHAYEKLGVHSRNQLLARFFEENYWPSMQRDELLAADGQSALKPGAPDADGLLQVMQV